MNIVEFYSSLLASMDVVADDKGLLSIKTLDGELIPVSVKGKRLILPTREFLRDPDFDTFMAFHPMSESVLVGGESLVLKKLRELVKFRLNAVATALLSDLMRIAVEKDLHKKMTPKQTGLLAVLKDAVPQTHAATMKFLEQVSINNDRSLISVYLKAGGQWKGKKFSKVAVTSFPPMKDFERDDKSVFGVELGAKRDKLILKELFTYIFEDAETPEEYSFGSNDMSAPLLHALLSMYATVAKQLNKITKQFKNLLNNADSLAINLDWEPVLNELHTMRDKIPALEGNEGSATEGSPAAKRSAVDQSALYRSVQEENEPTPSYSRKLVDEPEGRIIEAEYEVHTEEQSNSPFRKNLNAPQNSYPATLPIARPPIHPQPASRQPQREEMLHAADRERRRYGHRHEDDYQDDVIITENGADWNSIVRNNPAVQNTLAMTYHNNPGIAHRAMSEQYANQGGTFRGAQRGMPSYDSYYQPEYQQQQQFSRGGFANNAPSMNPRAMSRGAARPMQSNFSQRDVYGTQRRF